MEFDSKKSTPKEWEVPWEETYRRLIEEAPYIPGDAGESLEGAEIEWANPELLKIGQQFVKENMIAISLAHSGALILGFSLKNLSTILLRTGGFSGVSNCIDRIIDTEVHLREWYNSDVYYQSGDGHKGIQKVRKMHSLALKKCMKEEEFYVPNNVDPMEAAEKRDDKLRFLEAMKKDLEFVDTSEAPKHLLTYNPKQLMSQFDMALTQYGFFAIVYAYPRPFAVNDPKGLEGYVHLWAVIGRLMGVRDRYNLALNPKLELIKKIHNQIGMASLKEADLTVATLQFDFGEALCKLLPIASLKTLIYQGFTSQTSMPDYQGSALYEIMTFKEKCCVLWFRFFFFLMLHFGWLKRGITKAFDEQGKKLRVKVAAAKKRERAAKSNSRRA